MYSCDLFSGLREYVCFQKYFNIYARKNKLNIYAIQVITKKKIHKETMDYNISIYVYNENYKGPKVKSLSGFVQ